MDPTLHNRLREFRQAREWTQEHLASQVGVSRQSINSIERDRYIPSLPLALLLARVFACPLEQIFTLDADPAAQSKPRTEPAAPYQLPEPHP